MSPVGFVLELVILVGLCLAAVLWRRRFVARIVVLEQALTPSTLTWLAAKVDPSGLGVELFDNAATRYHGCRIRRVNGTKYTPDRTMCAECRAVPSEACIFDVGELGERWEPAEAPAHAVAPPLALDSLTAPTVAPLPLR